MENMNEEWKRVWDRSYLKTIAAFYNTDGGCMIVGRDDDGTFVGLSDPKGTLKAVSDAISNVLDIRADVRLEMMEGVPCIVIEVPKGSNLVDYDGRYYKRVGNTTQQLRHEELKEALIRERGRFWMDEPCGLTVFDVSDDAVRFFVRKGKSVDRIPDEVSESDVLGTLSRFNLSTSDGMISYAAAFLFCEHPRSINDGVFLKIGEFNTDDSLKRESIIDLPLIEIPDEAIRLIYESYRPPEFRYGNGASRELWYEYPVDAVRELIVNALVHKDYKIHEPVTVSIYPDRMEVYCHGGLPDGWTTEDLKAPHVSVRRNETLANVFHEAGYVENWAQGIGKVMRLCKNNGNPEPSFSIRLGGLLSTIETSRGTSDPGVTQQDTTKSSDLGTSIISLIREDPHIRSAEIAERLGVSERTVFREISKLIEYGKIRREGKGKARVFVVL